jgi:hypothetical protein
MAYATNLSEMPIRKEDQRPQFDFPGSDSGVPRTVHPASNVAARQAALQHLTNAIAYYRVAIVLLKKSTNVNEQRWLILPTELGLAWCLDQAGRREEAIQAYRKALGIAWKMEVTGDFSVEQWIRDVWNDVRSGQNPLRPHTRGYIGPGVCFSREIIDYLLKLLDPVKDAREIARLKQDQRTLLSMGRAITPLIVPLEPGAGLVDLVNPGARVTFDLDGSGVRRAWGWITPKAAWLVYDAIGCGQIRSGLQMFGNVTFWVFWLDGYEALAALDDDGDGVLRGSELNGLALWQDRNSNGVSDPGEVLPLSAWGITAVSCAKQRDASGLLWNPAGVTLTNGTTRPTYDWIAPSP